MNLHIKDTNEKINNSPPTLSLFDQERMIEAMLFASTQPLTLKEITNRMPDSSDVKLALKGLKERYKNRGFRIVKISDGYAFRTATDLSYLLQKHVVEKRKLSKAALEVLAVVAYHNSSTRAEIEEIRGVSVSAGTLDILMDLGWISLGTRRTTPGRPITFIVTRVFLDHFGLESWKDLPGINELRETGLLDRHSALSPATNGDNLSDIAIL